MAIQKLSIDTMCIGCGASVSARLHFDSGLQVVDSDGEVLFGNGFKCHNCLGQPWSTADLVL